MIGSKVSQMILDNKQLNFYKYDSDVKELLNQVRDTINQVCIFQPSVSGHALSVLRPCFSSSDFLLFRQLALMVRLEASPMRM